MIHEFHTHDSPMRPGHEPENGEAFWTFTFSLRNGGRLKLTVGRDTRQEMIGVLMQEGIDDAIEEVLKHGPE